MNKETYEAYRAAIQTVNVYQEILRRPLFVQQSADSEGRFTSGVLEIPATKYAYEWCELLLAHVVFRTSLAEIQSLAARMAKMATGAWIKTGVPRAQALAAETRLEVFLVASGSLLERYRVLSLWGELQPGGRRMIERMLRDNFRGAKSGHLDATLDLLLFIEASTIGLRGEHFETFEALPHIAEAVERAQQRVYKTTFRGGLAALRLFFSELIEAAAKDFFSQAPDSPDTPEDRLRQMMKSIDTLLDHAHGDDSVLRSLQYDMEQQGAGEEIGHLQGQQLAQRILREKGTAEDHVGKFKQALKEHFEKTREEVKKSRVQGLFAYKDVPLKADSSLTPSDRKAVQYLRKAFNRVHGRTVRQLETQGLHIDMHAYIQGRLSGRPEAVFRSDTRARGFDVVILVDLSTSMRNSLSYVSRTCEILARALRLPSIRLQIFGFSGGVSNACGQVKIFQCPRVSSMGSSSFDFEAVFGGSTPLHGALWHAYSNLSSSRSKRQVLVITDGRPEFGDTRSRSVSYEVLKSQCVEALQALKSSRTKVMALCLAPNAMPHVEQIFDTSVLVSPRDLGSTLCHHVEREVIQHLKG